MEPWQGPGRRPTRLPARRVPNRAVGVSRRRPLLDRHRGHVDLWRSDGTEGGTEVLKRFDGRADHRLASLEVIDGRVVISAADETGRFGLWTTDGTAKGTVLVKRVGSPHGFAGLDGVIYFRVSARRGEELWRTDLTAGGTRFVRILDRRGGSSQSQLFAAGGRLYLWSGTRSTASSLLDERRNGRRDRLRQGHQSGPGRSLPVFLQAPALGSARRPGRSRSLGRTWSLVSS